VSDGRETRASRGRSDYDNVVRRESGSISLLQPATPTRRGTFAHTGPGHASAPYVLSERREALERRLDARVGEPISPEACRGFEWPRLPSCVEFEVADCGGDRGPLAVVEDDQPARSNDLSQVEKVDKDVVEDVTAITKAASARVRTAEEEYGLAPLRVRGLERVALHADVVMLPRLSQALARARTVTLAA
jgi:hypothetical protein